METRSIEPVLIDFEKDILKTKLRNGTVVNMVKNESNELFNLKIVFNLGAKDKVLALATEYLKFAGTRNYTAAELKSEFYKIGCTFSLYTDSYSTSIYFERTRREFTESHSVIRSGTIKFRARRRDT